MDRLVGSLMERAQAHIIPNMAQSWASTKAKDQARTIQNTDQWLENPTLKAQEQSTLNMVPMEKNTILLDQAMNIQRPALKGMNILTSESKSSTNIWQN